jgi:hypothetical protein
MFCTWYPIRNDVRAALSGSVEFGGPAATIVDQLDPAVWPQTRLVLEKAGAVFVPGTSRFEFDDDQDAAAVVAGLLAAGRVQSATASHGWVPTPTDVAEDVAASYGEIGGVSGRRLRILEPSAGTGRLVDAVLRGALFDEDRDERCAAIAGWAHVTAVEMEPRRARHIPASAAVDVIVDDFLQLAARAAVAGDRWDRIVMNPPFSVPGSPQAWAVHVLAAWRLLAPGGRLAAIVPASIRHASGKGAAVAALADWHGGIDDLDDDAFVESGVVVPTAVVWLDRPLAAEQPARAGLPYLFRVYTGDERATPVDRPMLARSAAASTPVQVWRDAWRGGRERLLRYRADCALCTRPLWGFDDGENDPRGVLGDASAGFSVDPAEAGLDGVMPVGLCPMCDSGQNRDTVLSLARRDWADVVTARSAPTVVSRVVPTARRVGPVEQLAMF